MISFCWDPASDFSVRTAQVLAVVLFSEFVACFSCVAGPSLVVRMISFLIEFAAMCLP
jgi:hypothetical protein